MATRRPISWREAWVRHANAYVSAVAQSRLDEAEARWELIFCLLGGHGVPFELAASAWERLREIDCLEPSWDLGELEFVIAAELNRPQFRPVRRDGSLRRYRYPTSKATQTVRAIAWMAQYTSLTEAIVAISNETERRDFIRACPGVGPKTASWFLRNAGYACELAVLDIHILRALAAEGRLPRGRLPGAYARIEEAFIEWCRELTAPPAAFDLFLWEWQRGSRSVGAPI